LGLSRRNGGLRFAIRPTGCDLKLEARVKISELADELRKAYESSEGGKKVVSIHLFGIRRANELDGQSCKDIAVLAGIPHSYATEIRKGMNLAPYVSLRGAD